MSSATERLFPIFDKFVRGQNLSGKIIVDFGCGFGRWGHIIRSEIDKGGEEAYIVGCDVFLPYLQKVKKYNPYDDLILCDIRYLPFREQSIDIGIAFELIEHLRKDEGLKFILNLEKICKEQIIISTPFGYYAQDECRGNIFEKHQCSWAPEDFKSLKFEVLISGFGKDFELTISNSRILQKILKILKQVRSKNLYSGLMIGASKQLTNK